MTMLPFFLTMLLAQDRASAVEAPPLPPPTRPAYQMTAEDLAAARRGIALHDQQKYDDAIAVYEELTRAHPDNAVILHEWALTLLAKKAYQAAIDRAAQCAQYRSAALESCYALVGTILDTAGQPQKAIEAYTSALQTLPASGTLHYNLATTYVGLKDLDHARQTLKQGAMAAPAHAGIHLALGRLFLDERLRGPAFLALSHFLLIEPNSARTAEAYNGWLLALNGVGTPNGQGGLSAGVNTRETSEGSQVELDVVLVASQAAEAKLAQGEMAGQSRIAIMAERLRMLFGAIGALTPPADNPSFTWTYYVPFFREMAARGFVEPYVYYVSQRTNLPGVREWMTSHQAQLQALSQWVNSYRWPTVKQAPFSAANSTSSIKGVVTDGLSGKAIPQVRVAVLGTASVNTKSDDQGTFEIVNLPPGAYSLLVDVPGRGTNRHGELRPDGGSTGLTLTAGQQLHGLQLRSWPRATLSGRITSPDGKPVPGAVVEIARRVFTLASYREDYRHEAVAESDASGTYRADLPAGSYLVTVRSTNVTIPASVQEVYHQELTRPSLGTRVAERLRQSAAPTITGRGLTVGAFSYQVMALMRPQAPAVPSSSAGVATTYHANARAIDLRAGEPASLDFKLEVVPAFSVSGVVEGPVDGGMVAVRLTSLTEPAMMQFSAGPALSSETAVAITDARGAFTMLGVPPGRYEAFVRVGDDPTTPPARQSGTTASARAEVTVDGDVKGLVLTLRPTPTVTGQIEFVGDPQPTNQQKAVMRFGLYEDLLSSTPKPLQPVVRPDGSFQVAGQVPGRYWPTADLGEWSLEHITINGQSFDDRVIVVGDEGLSGVRVVATRRTGRRDVVWGSVNLPPATNPSDANVAVFPVDYAQRLAALNFTTRHARFIRLRQPEFNVGAMPPGDYYVVAYNEAHAQDPTKAFLDTLTQHATRVTVREGQPTKVELVLSALER